VNILLGNGDGSFQPPYTVAAGRNAYGVTAADLTNNGILDLVVTHASLVELHPATTVSVLLGNGDGTFQPPVDYEVGTDPHAVAVGDFNGDGVPDLVVANTGVCGPAGFCDVGTTVSVLLGNGDGTFQDARSFDVAGISPASVAVGDFAGDGRLSIVTADNGFRSTVPGDVSFLLGNGDGTFQPPVALRPGALGAVRAVAVADLNNDGHADLVVTIDSANGGSVGVLLGRGDNTFQNAVAFPASTNPAFSPLHIAVGDFNGDGRLDLAVSALIGANVYVLPGNGDGSFQPPVSLDAVVLAGSLVAGDFTGAGPSDLAVVNPSGNNISIFLANPDGFFFTASTVQGSIGGTDLHAADLTGRGVPDLVAVNPQTNTVNVLLGQGDGTFQDPTAYAVGQKPRSVTVADLTGRGVPDLVAVNEGDRTLSVLLGNGDGTFQPAQTIAPVLDDGFIPERVAVGDFDGDGKPDLAILQRHTQNDRSAVLVLHGNGDGTFSQTLPNRVLAFPVQDFLANFILQAADLRHSGTLDLLLGGGLAGVIVLLGNGDGTFGAPRLLETGRNSGNVARAAVVADVNDDGIPDLVVADDESGNPGNVSVLLGNGDGSFQPAVLYPVDFTPLLLAVGDFFGDGTLGVATANFGGGTVSVLRGHSDGTLGLATNYLVGFGPGQLAAGDFNGDGAPDLAVLHTSRARGDLSIVLNRNDGTAPDHGPSLKSPRHAAARVHRAQPDTTLGKAVAPTPALDTTASAPAAGPRVSPADAYFAALAAAGHDGVVPNRRQESRIPVRAMRPAQNQDADWAALLGT
jgi:hypothetical protein